MGSYLGMIIVFGISGIIVAFRIYYYSSDLIIVGITGSYSGSVFIITS